MTSAASSQLRVIISGAGSAGFLHALAYRASGATIAAVYDPDPAKARALAASCGGAVAPSLEALGALDASIASVCSPPRAHVEQAALLTRPGRVVVVEKPVATSRTDLDRLSALPGCVPVVQWRAGRALRALRRAVEEGVFGEAPSASCDLAWARDDAYLGARGAAWGCGALLSIGIHAVDALAWALGQSIDGVSAMMHQRRDGERETAAVALLRFRGGAIATLRISFDGGGDTTRIVTCGRGVTASLDGGEADPSAGSLSWSAPRGERRRLEALERGVRGALGAPLLVPYLGDVVAAVREGQVAGETEALPAIAETYDAHAAVLCMLEHAEGGPPA